MTNAALRSVDLRRIRHFVVLADTLNFHRASQRLHMTQPPLTVSIQKLETELGVQLFERHARGVRLTPSGEAALGDARQILHHAVSFAEKAALAQSGMAGLLRVGFVGSATQGVLQRLIPRFRAEYPQVELLLRDSSSMQILRELADERIDIGLLWTPVLDAMGSEFLTLQRQSLVVALPQGHPLARRRKLALSELRDERFIMYDATQAEGMRSVCMLLCQQAGFVPRSTQEAIQIQTVLALVQTGLGIALVPSMMAELAHAQLVFLPLHGLADQQLIALAMAYRAQSGQPAVQRMRALAAQEFGLEEVGAVRRHRP